MNAYIVLIVTAIYITLSIYKSKKFPESISETSYIWESNCDHKQFHKAHIFTWYCLLIAALLFPIWISHTNQNWQFLAFLGSVGICGAGITPFFKEKFQAPIHYGGGILAMLCYMMWMIFSGNVPYLAISMSVATILTIIKRKSWVFWYEICGLISLCIKLI